MTWRIIEADCVAAMREMDEASVDAICTDPPYGLEFMGKEWDRLGAGVFPVEDTEPIGRQSSPPFAGGGNRVRYGLKASQEWHQAWATEALRVLKPGGHLLAFGGTRTYHRLACAVEDAGFEIRDSIAWHHMSHVFCQCDDPRSYARSQSETEHDLRPVRDGDVSKAVPTEGGEGEVLHEGVSEPSASEYGAVPEQGSPDGAEPSLEGRGDSEAPEGELRGGALRESAGVGEADGAQGRLRDGASAGDGAEGGASADEDGMRSPSGPQSGEQPADELGAMAVEWIAQGRGAWPGCPGCGKPLAPPVFAGPLAHTYGSGFPKSLDVSKAMDRAGGASINLRAVAEHIRERRKAAGVSVAEMATWFPYAEVTKNWERTDPGQRIPSCDDYALLVKRIDADPDLEVRRAAAEREVIAHTSGGHGWANDGLSGHKDEYDITAPATPEAQRWQGWGTALKPAHEPIVVARKPLIGTVAQNVSEFGTGALNIDGCRIGYQSDGDARQSARTGDYDPYDGADTATDALGSTLLHGEQHIGGRWPANVALSHLPECERVGERRVKGGGGESAGRLGTRETVGDFGYDRTEIQRYDSDGLETVEAWRCALGCPVAELDRQSGELGVSVSSSADGKSIWGSGGAGVPLRPNLADRGGASRFFYTAKASRAERNAGLEGFEERETRGNYGDGIQDARPHTPEGYEYRATTRNSHPTVKPVDLMRWLCRLVTPPGGRILDCFAGSGTTGIAAILEGFDFIGIEREPEYVEIAKARIAWWDTHKDRAEEILALSSKSERERAEHEAAGQMGLLDG